MSNSQPNWMIYGANGYTGRLVAAEARRRGLSPILAGRSPEVEGFASELGFKARVFSLEQSVSDVARALQGVTAVLHCAGPFSATSRKMLDACLQAKVHYLDITGEIEVFESIHARDSELKAAGIVALPGAGFDVVPSDCLAAMLKRKLPTATRLTLAFYSTGGTSPGTAKSMVEGIAAGGRVRRGGKIVPVPIASKWRKIPFGSKELWAALTPWGDVSTAYHSTGIPEIEFYIATPRRAEFPMKIAARLMQVPGLQAVAKSLISRAVKGPEEQVRERARCWLWGEVEDASGRRETMSIQVPEGYRFTAATATECAFRVARGDLQPGAWTPSRAFGADFVLSFEGVQTQVRSP